MTIKHRRALIDRLLEKEATAGRAIDRDGDFMILVELWIAGAIDMSELRQRYQLVRQERVANRRVARMDPQEKPRPPDDPSHADGITSAIAFLIEP